MTGPTIERVPGDGRTAPPPPTAAAQPAANGNGRLPTPPPTALRRRRSWRPGLLLLGLFLVVGSMLGGILLFDSVTTTTPVLVAATDLEEGRILADTDVRVAYLSLPPDVPALTYDERRFLGGEDTGQPVRALRGFVPEGAVLTEEHFINRSETVEAGTAIIGLRLQSGWYPSALEVGDRVELFATSDRDLLTEAVPLGQADVWRIWKAATVADPTGDLVVDLVIDESLQPTVVQAQAAGALRLTVVRDG